MKTLKFFILSFVVLVSAINLSAADRSVSFPSYKIPVKKGEKAAGKQDSEFRITAVSISSERTAVSCEMTFLKSVKSCFYFDEYCCLFYRTADGVVESELKDAEGVQICREGETPPDKIRHKAGEKYEFTLYFDPIPDDVSNFDFIEKLFGDINRVDISLTEGAASREEQRIVTCPYDDVIKGPTFLGQEMNSFSKWVGSHLRYPWESQMNDEEGRLVIRIHIDTDGNAQYEIVEASSAALNIEAMRVVTDAPKWEPATICGKPVGCSLNFPVIFELRPERSIPSRIPR